MTIPGFHFRFSGATAAIAESMADLIPVENDPRTDIAIFGTNYSALLPDALIIGHHVAISTA
jgi:hypothetical protein